MTLEPDHAHTGLMTEGDPQAFEPYDTAALSRLVGAAFDGCQPCQQELVPVVAADAVAVTRLIEVVGMMTQDQIGGIPASMYTLDAPGLTTPEFRTILRVAVKTQDRAAAVAAARVMTDAQRTAALDSATELVVGYMIAAG